MSSRTPTRPAAPAIIQARTIEPRVEILSDNVRLILGDAIEIIPTLPQIDGLSVVTDSPYGIGDLVVGYGRTLADHKGTTDRHILNDRNLDVMVAVFDQIQKRFNNLWLVTFYSPRISPAFFAATSNLEFFAEVIWDKRSWGLGSQVRYAHESIAFFKIGKPEELGQISSVLAYFSVRGKARSGMHPHEKPLQLMENLVEAVPGKTILDPFLGSGGTGAAAVRLRRGFIGVELSPQYFEVALRKVSEAMKQQPYFWEY
jgi:DNA methylase